jgi:hypothetical protein
MTSRAIQPTQPTQPTQQTTAEIKRRARETWNAFCEDLKRAGDQLIRDDLPLDELDAAEGLRYLSRLVRTGLERHVEGADPADTYLYSLCDERIKGFGGDNPDTRYFGASISSDHTYRLTADLRSCAFFSIMATGFDENGAYRVTGSLDGAAIPAFRTGPVEIAIRSDDGGASADGRGEMGAGTGPASATLSTTRDTRSLLVRCTFDDSVAKQKLRLTLSRVDASGEPVQCAFEPISKGLLETAKFVRSTAESCAGQSVGLRKNFNQLPLSDPERIRKMGGDPNIFYYSAAWSVAEDEFLVIHLPTIPECTTWGLQLNNLWTESLDYTQAPIHLNKTSAHYDADGGVTIVVSERDPGRPNWLRTLGHRTGTANLRLMGAKEPVVAELEIVSSAELI